MLSTPEPVRVALAAVVEHPLPVVAMVAGYAVGGGCTLAAGYDIRIVGASSRFGMPPAKLGLVYSATELRPFVDLIGPSRTKWMFSLGGLIDAAAGAPVRSGGGGGAGRRARDVHLRAGRGDRRERAALGPGHEADRARDARSGRAR